MKATTRTDIGTNKVKFLRRKGLIPGIIYGHGEAPVPITINEHEVELAIQHGERMLDIDLDGQSNSVLIKDVQYDTFEHEVLHVDLMRVDMNEEVEVTVAVHLVGTPAGVQKGGVLQQLVPEVTIAVPAKNIPEEIRLLITGLELDGRLLLSDLELPEGAKLVDSADAILCTCAELAEEIEVVEGEGSDEPEVIGEKKDEDAADE